MKTYIALFFVTLAVLQCNSAPASDSVEPEEAEVLENVTEKEPIVCEPETVFKVACNSCHCNKEGTRMACTRRACIEEYNEDGSPKVSLSTMETPSVNVDASDKSPEEKKRVCEPGTSLKEDCNTCFCAKDGSGYACTRMACPPGPTEKLTVVASSEKAITEATSEVTTKAVSEVTSEIDLQNIPKIPWGPLYVPGTPCPGKTFYSECNQCFCSKTGNSAGCTLMLCDGLRKIHDMQTEDALEVA